MLCMSENKFGPCSTCIRGPVPAFLFWYMATLSYWWHSVYDYIFQKKRTDGVVCAILMALYTALLEIVQVHHTVSFGSINAKQRRHWLWSVWSQPQLFWPQPKLFLVAGKNQRESWRPETINGHYFKNKFGWLDKSSKDINRPRSSRSSTFAQKESATDFGVGTFVGVFTSLWPK